MPCLLDAPPGEDWAHVHVDGLVHSMSTTFAGGVLIQCYFGSSMFVRTLKHPGPWERRWRSWQRELADPDAIEWSYRMVIAEIRGEIGFDLPRGVEGRLQRLRDRNKIYCPAAVAFGRPYFLV